MSSAGQDDLLQDHRPDVTPATPPAGALEAPAVASRAIVKPDAPPPDYAALLAQMKKMDMHRRAALFVAVVSCLVAVTCLYLVRGERAAMAQPAPAPQADAQQPPVRDRLDVREVIFSDAAGHRGARLRLDESGGIAFCDAEGVKRALFSTSPEGDTRWTLFSAAGQERVSLGVMKDGVGHMAVCDEDRKHITFLDASGLTLNQEGRSRGQFLLVDGLAGVSIFDPQHRSRIGIGMNRDGPTFEISDEQGKPVFFKP